MTWVRCFVWLMLGSCMLAGSSAVAADWKDVPKPAAGKALPRPMSSAIERLTWPWQMAGFPPKGDEPRVLALPPFPVKMNAGPCSIPLVEAKVPDNVKFVMEPAPRPRAAKDGMPVLKARVCEMAQAK